VKPPPSLAELQERFHELLRAPEGVGRGLETLVARGEVVAPDLSGWIRGDERLDATARLDIYASMYFYRLRDVLAEEFERTASRVGEAHFHNLITDYLIAHPPGAPSLREAGAALPDFLVEHPLGASFAALSDVARIERARLEVFDGPDEIQLDRESFLAHTTHDPEGFRLRVARATRLLEVDPRSLDWWEDPSAQPGTGPPRRTHVLVFRKRHAVYHRECVEDEARCLDAVSETPHSLADLAERLLKHDASAEETSERFAALLELWAGDEILVFPPSGTRA